MKSILVWVLITIPSVLAAWLTLIKDSGSEVSFNEFVSQALNGGVGAYRAGILLLILFLSLVLLYIGKRAAFGEVKSYKVKFFFFLSAPFYVIFSLLGSEFSAPSNTAASFFDFQEGYSTSKVVRRSDVEFDLDACQRWGNKITCVIDVHNYGDDDSLQWGTNSYLVDNSNNQAKVMDFTIGSQSYGRLQGNEIPLPAKAKAKLRVAFEANELEDATLVRALYLNVRLGGKIEKIPFRNISL